MPRQQIPLCNPPGGHRCIPSCRDMSLDGAQRLPWSTFNLPHDETILPAGVDPSLLDGCMYHRLKMRIEVGQCWVHAQKTNNRSTSYLVYGVYPPVPTASNTDSQCRQNCPSGEQCVKTSNLPLEGRQYDLSQTPSTGQRLSNAPSGHLTRYKEFYIHYLPKSNSAPVHNVCSVVANPLESRSATSCGYNSSHSVWPALYECLLDIHGDSSPFLLQPFHELSNRFWPRLTSPHPAIQFVPKMFYRVEVGALGGPVQSANIVVGVSLYSSPRNMAPGIVILLDKDNTSGNSVRRNKDRVNDRNHILERESECPLHRTQQTKSETLYSGAHVSRVYVQTLSAWYYKADKKTADVKKKNGFGCVGDALTRSDALMGGGGEVVRLLDSHIGEPGSIPDGVAPGFSHGAAVVERVACSTLTEANRGQAPAGYSRILASGNRAGRCRWSAGFLGDLQFPFPLVFHSHLISSSSALETSLLRAAQITELDSAERFHVLYICKELLFRLPADILYVRALQTRKLLRSILAHSPLVSSPLRARRSTCVQSFLRRLAGLHHLPISNWAPVHNACSVVVTPLESRRATSCGYNSSHPVWHALYECLQDIHGDSSPFLLQPFHGLSNGFWPRLTSPHSAIQFVLKMFYRVEVGALGGPVQSANIVVGLLVGGFSWGSPVSLTSSFWHRSIFISIPLIGSQDHDVKSRPNIFTRGGGIGCRVFATCCISQETEEVSLSATTWSGTRAHEDDVGCDYLRPRAAPHGNHFQLRAFSYHFAVMPLPSSDEHTQVPYAGLAASCTTEAIASLNDHVTLLTCFFGYPEILLLFAQTHFNPRPVHCGFSQVRILPDYAAGRRHRPAWRLPQQNAAFLSQNRQYLRQNNLQRQPVCSHNNPYRNNITEFSVAGTEKYCDRLSWKCKRLAFLLSVGLLSPERSLESPAKLFLSANSSVKKDVAKEDKCMDSSNCGDDCKNVPHRPEEERSSIGMQRRGKRKIPEKTRRLANVKQSKRRNVAALTLIVEKTPAPRHRALQNNVYKIRTDLLTNSQCDKRTEDLPWMGQGANPRLQVGHPTPELWGKVVSYSAPTETAPGRVSCRPSPVSLPPPEQTRDRDSHKSARATRRRRARTQLTRLPVGPSWHPTVEWPHPRTRRPPTPYLSVLFYFVLFIFFPRSPFCSNISIVQDIEVHLLDTQACVSRRTREWSFAPSHQGKPGSLPGRVTPGFSHVGIVPEDAAGRRDFSGISRFSPPFIPTLLHTQPHLPSSALETSMFRAAQIYSLTH
ncbi:hypothetical protein PR048_031624 [Dryococelus australis]|uniref:Uncharacterized protein n=1 Tax=Dryococelus australis TaxID=614101 RepID=A0ABQ9G5T7_9NEOP|nr:hypothetical protein PR048_031624 [Dryococelus australis]